MDNIENSVESVSNNIEQVQQEAVEIASVADEAIANTHELTDNEIDEILNEAANELGVEMPNVVESEHNIPTNSPTILLDETHSRFSAAAWAEEINKQNVVLGGCGGISSWCSLLLSRVNPHYLYIYDPDIVEQANMSGQLFRSSDIGAYKVNAMFTTIEQYSNYHNIVTNRYRITSQSNIFTPVMICGFDNMQARKDFYSIWKRGVNNNNKKQCLYIDGRIKC